MNDEDEEAEGKRWLWRLAGTGSALLALYALSYGPACWFCYHTDPDQLGWPTFIVDKFYDPLEAVAFATGTWTLLFEYVNLFIPILSD